MTVTINVIPHGQQRYATPADWQFDQDGDVLITVSKMGDWRYEALCAVHELVEVLVCRHQGVTQEQVDQFDMRYETERTAGQHDAADEPGDDPSAPYRAAHFVATTVERVLAVALGVDWAAYSEAVAALERT